MSTFNLRGAYILEHRSADGSLKGKYVIDNTVTTVGKQEVVKYLRATKTAGFTRIALGSSSTAAVIGNTTLAAEITSPSLKRASATSTAATTTVTDDTSQLVHTYTSTATQTVQEAGVFDTATSGGNMISRTTFSAKNLTSGDTLQVTYKVIVS